MKVGVLQFFFLAGRHGPLEEVYERALERIEIMDKSGFDAGLACRASFLRVQRCPSVTCWA